MKMKIWRTSRITMRHVWPKLINKLRWYKAGSNKRKSSSQRTGRLNMDFFRTPQANPKAIEPCWRFQMTCLLHMNRSKHCRKQCRNRCEQCSWKSRNTNLSSMNSNLSSMKSIHMWSQMSRKKLHGKSSCDVSMNSWVQGANNMWAFSINYAQNWMMHKSWRNRTK